MNNNAKKNLVMLYNDALETSIKARKLNKCLTIAFVAGFLCSVISSHLQKDKEARMQVFNEELNKIPMSEGDTACDD